MPENANPKPAAPNPSTATETLPASPPINPMSELFAGLEKLGVNGPEDKPAKSEPKKEAAAKSPPSKSASGAKEASEKKTSDTTSGKTSKDSSAKPVTSAPDNAATKVAEKPVPAPELRKAYEELKAKHKALEEEHKAWKTREDPEKKTLAEKAEAAAKRVKELDERLKIADYRSHDDYKRDFIEPLNKAYEESVRLVTSLTAISDEGEERQASKADLDAILAIEDPGKAAKESRKIFGDYGPYVMGEWRKIWDHIKKGQEAVAQHAKMGEEKAKADFEKNRELAKKREEIFQAHMKEAKEQFPHYFTEEEGDEEGNNLLKRGYSKYEAVFNGGHALDKDGNPIDLTDEQLAELHAEVFNKSAGFNRLAMKLTKASSRIKELEEELAQFQASEPKEGEGEPEKEEGEPSWEQELEKFAMR